MYRPIHPAFLCRLISGSIYAVQPRQPVFLQWAQIFTTNVAQNMIRHKRPRTPSESSCGGDTQNDNRDVDASGKRYNTNAQSKSDAKFYKHTRQWLKIKGANPRRSRDEGEPFSIMTYNILSQQLLEDNEYLYSNTDPSNLEWRQRKRKIVKEIRQYMPDILCLQEVQQDHYDEHLQPVFSDMGYSTLYKKRTGYKPDGCALLFKKSKFELEKSSNLEYYQGKHGLMNRDNVAIVALLKMKSRDSGRVAKICVATTHVLFNMKRGDVKLGQMCMLMAEIDAILAGRTLPLIVCGDFNCYPFSPLYNFVSYGHLTCNDLFSDCVSGQPDYYSRRSRPLEKGSLPPPGIDENCRYIPKTEPPPPGVEPTQEEQSSSEISPDRSSPTQYSQGNLITIVEQGSMVSRPTVPQPTGNLYHSFKLVSAYTHFTQRGSRFLPELTTHHGRGSNTVDYLFYSVDSRQSTKCSDGYLRPCNVVEGNLTLLERLDLVVAPEAHNIGCLPSGQFGSDHFSLMCKFHLKYEA